MTPPRFHRDRRRLWRRLAGAALVAVVATVTTIILRAGRAPADADADAVDVIPPDITSIANSGTGIPRAGQTHLQFLDRNDPGRIAGELIARSLEPLEGKRFRVVEPRSWLYLRDGRTLVITAASGVFSMPEEQRQPDRGVLEGGVVARLYPAGLPRPVDPEREREIGRFEARSMRFDGNVGELATPDEFTGFMTTDDARIDYAGRGLRAFGDQVEERLARLEVDEGRHITVTPVAPVGEGPAGPAGRAADRAAPQPPSQPSTQPPPQVSDQPGRQAPADAAPGREALYAARFETGVVVTRGDMVIHSDSLDAWARLIDQRLPADAIGELFSDAASEPAPAPAPPPTIDDASGPTGAAPPPGGLATDPAQDPGPTPAGAPPPVELRWTGPLRVALQPEVPPELEADHLSLRFETAHGGSVRFSDAATGLAAAAGTAEYRATTSRLVLAAPQPGGVRVSSPQAGLLRAGRAEADLRVGVARIVGAGELSQLASGRSLGWADQADLVLRVSGGKVMGVGTAQASGGVAASEGGSKLRGDFVRAEFSPGAGGDSLLSRAVIEGSAMVSRDEAGWIEADLLDVAFESDAAGKEALPRRVDAAGAVVASRGNDEVRGDRLTADLRPDGDGGVAVTFARLEGSAVFTRVEPGRPLLTASADRFVARPDRQLVDLISETDRPAEIRRGPTSIRGPQVALDGADRSIRVFGAGDLSHDEAPGRSVRAAWSESLEFTDRTGVGRAFGRVEALLRSDARSADTLRAWSLMLELEPAPDESESDGLDSPIEGQRPAPAEADRADRRLLRAVAQGAFEGDMGPATVESRRFEVDAFGLPTERVETLTYLEGAVIEADQVAGSITVPAGGKLLALDRRATNEPEAGGGPETQTVESRPGPGRLAVGSRGTSLFTWAESLVYERDTSRAELLGDVTLTHAPWDGGPRVFVDCRSLVANLRPGSDPFAPRGATDAELSSVVASGAVVARSGDRELAADRLVYDAVAGTAVATSPGSGVVRTYDARTGAVVTAAELWWDLLHDRIEIRRPAPMVSPN